MIRTEIDETKLDSGLPYCFEEGERGGIPNMSHISQVQVEERAERGRERQVGETVHGEELPVLEAEIKKKKARRMKKTDIN